MVHHDQNSIILPLTPVHINQMKRISFSRKSSSVLPILMGYGAESYRQEIEALIRVTL